MPERLQKTTKNIYAVTIIIGTCFLMCSMIFLNSMMKQNEQTYISDLVTDAQKKEVSISKQIEGDFQTLKAIAVCIGDMSLTKPEQYQHLLKEINDNNGFMRMGMADVDGQLGLFDVGSSGPHFFDISEREFFQKALSGEASISETFPDSLSDSGEYINYYGVPVYKEDKIIGILCAVNSAKVFYDIVSVPVLSDSGFSSIIDENGKIINCFQHDNAAGIYSRSVKDLGAYTEDNKEIMLRGLANKELAIFEYEYNEETQIAIVNPIEGVDDWLVLSSVPLAKLRLQYARTALGANVIICSACIIFMVLLIWQRQIMVSNQKNLMNVAYIDSVTGHNNYQKFLLDAEELIEHLNSRYTVWYCDLKRFKYFNDIFGYSKGDEVLKKIAVLLKEDSGGKEIFCRVSADNFAGIKINSSKKQLVRWFLELAEKINEKAELSNRIKIEFCMGFYCSEDSQTLSVNDMVNRAIMAQNSVKNQHGNKFAFFTPELRQKNLLETEMESRGQDALDQEEFVVYYQPKIDIQDHNRIVSAEALVRWLHPEHGLISPGLFIPFFEKSEMIVKLDRYMLEHVCSWLKSYLTLDRPPINIAVNVSRLGILQSDFIDYYSSVKEKYKIPDGILELEFTESVALDGDDMFYQTVVKLQEKGFICSLDDFGSGYSSLNILKNLPINVLKLDILFFRKSMNTKRERIIIANVINMAKQLEMKTIAEGVETEEQVEFLRTSGCNLVQGYIFEKPMPLNDFERLLYDKSNISFIPQKADVT